jgi:hypothetical protein
MLSPAGTTTSPVTKMIPLECNRDRHLFKPGPKRLLALDGGGVRGAISVAFLERIEAVLAARLGREVRLGDWFDLVGGTSTGAVIAGALALGYRAQDVKEFYLRLAPRVFKRPFWRIMGLQAKFDANALREEIAQIVGDRTLGSTDLITGLGVVTKRMDTGSPWIVTNNPAAPYWNTPPAKPGDNTPLSTGNRYYKLANLVRASTAAPFYFDPELLPIVEGEPYGLFVDGGVTPHNNPSLILFLMTILKSYGIHWQTGTDKLTVVSIGTGSYRDQFVPDQLGLGRTAKITYRALMSLMNDAQAFILLQMQYLGECLTPWLINSEVGTLAGDGPSQGKLFRYMRYDVRLEPLWLKDNLGVDLTPKEAVRLRAMDDPSIIQPIYELATMAAAKQVKAEHWVGDLPDFVVAPATVRSASS